MPPPPCPWCGETLPRIVIQQFESGLDDLPCPRCGREVPKRLVDMRLR